MALNNDFSNAGESEVLWHDRKRILGMPISFTSYAVDRERLTCKSGFFRTEVEEILVYRIMDIKMSRSLGQKILGVGSIQLYSADQTSPNFEIQNIKKPEEVRKFLSRLVEYARTQKGISGREIYGAAGAALHGAVNNPGPANGDMAPPPPPPEFTDADGDGIPD